MFWNFWTNITTKLIYHLLYETRTSNKIRCSAVNIITAICEHKFSTVSITASFFHRSIIRYVESNNVPVLRWTSIKRIKSLLVLNTIIGCRRLRDKSRQFWRQHSGIVPFKSPTRRRRIDLHAALSPRTLFRQSVLVKLQINAETKPPPKNYNARISFELTGIHHGGPSPICTQVFTCHVIG